MPAPRTISIDMTGVSSRTLVPEGKHVVAVDSVEQKVASSGKPTLEWKFKVTSPGPSEGSTLYHNTSLQPQALWKLRSLLVALGMSVPNSLMKLDLGGLVGKRCTAIVAHEVYEGKTKARISDVEPAENLPKAVAADDEDDL